MNSTDLHTLLANAPVSRTTFFTQLLAKPASATQREAPSDELPSDKASEAGIALVYTVGFTNSGFSA